jgi:hypothetical protein
MEQAFRRVEDGEQGGPWDGQRGNPWGSSRQESRQEHWSSQGEQGRWNPQGSWGQGDHVSPWERERGSRQGGQYGWPGQQDPQRGRSQHWSPRDQWDGRESGGASWQREERFDSSARGDDFPGEDGRGFRSREGSDWGRSDFSGERGRSTEEANQVGRWGAQGNGGGCSSGGQRNWSGNFGSEPWRSMSPNPSGREYDRSSAEGGFAEDSRWDSRGSRAEGRGKAPKGYRRSDERIREEIAESVMECGEIDASEVQIDVSNGNVTLQGTVSSRRTKNLLEEIADCVSGVEDIDNQIKVKRGSQDSFDSSNRSGSGSSSSGSQSAGSASGHDSDTSKTASSQDAGRTAQSAGRTSGAVRV